MSEALSDKLYVSPALDTASWCNETGYTAYLYVHKGVTQSFLDLFRAYYNLRTRRWGRHKNTSAHECITGQPVHDWLTVIGFPPSQPLH